MSIIYNDTQEKTELQRRIAADLKEKQARRPQIDGNQKTVDFSDADYTREFESSGPAAWLWAILAIAFVGLIIYLLVK